MTQPHPQTVHDAPESAEPLAVAAPGSLKAVDPADAIENDDTVFIELNFKAFADNVPTNMHAKRRPASSDPSIQDFADQALELAALRAELKRLRRDYGVVQHQVRSRDTQLDALRRELSLTRATLRGTARSESQMPAPRVSSVTAEDRESSVDMPKRTESSQSLSNPTSTLKMLRVEAERSDPPPPIVAPEAAAEPRSEWSSPQDAVPQLIPMDKLGQPIALSREIVTIGRTRRNDICIPSRGVSRDHARLLITRSRVTLVNVSSTNGCFVNDEPVKRHTLSDGDQIRIGDRCFQFVRARGAAAR